MRTPPLAAVALGRLGYGPRPGDRERFDAIGLAAYLDEQLAPDDGADDELTARLAAARLPISYEAGDGYPALDEERPLRALAAPLATLWPLTDWERELPWEERMRPLAEVRAATLLRAVYSRWQLRELMVEFWHNHFNVNAENDDMRIAATWPLYDREVIRAHALGNFRELLEAVATSPAMLAYLNNAESKASPANENYARELFELHTLGSAAYLNERYEGWRQVPGATSGRPVGYIDDDVYEAARAFTGWTIADGAWTGEEELANTGQFHYHEAWHDPYQKRILGVELGPRLPPLADGRRALDLTATHQATAQHLCLKLCRRLVADEPPASLVATAVAAWSANLRSPDQIARTLRAIVLAPEFAGTWAQKLKRPYETAVSLLRATAADVGATGELHWLLWRHGYQQFAWPAPNGHPDTAGYWLGSNTTLGRWNIPLALLAGWIGGIRVDLVGQTPAGLSAREVAQHWAVGLLGYAPARETMTALVALVAQGGDPALPPAYDGPEDEADRLAALVALVAMTPEFQWR